MTDDLSHKLDPMIQQATRDLMFRVRQAMDGDYTKQIKVGITLQIGGKVYEHAVRSPALEGDDFIPERERPDFIT